MLNEEYRKSLPNVSIRKTTGRQRCFSAIEGSRVRSLVNIFENISLSENQITKIWNSKVNIQRTHSVMSGFSDRESVKEVCEDMDEKVRSELCERNIVRQRIESYNDMVRAEVGVQRTPVLSRKSSQNGKNDEVGVLLRNNSYKQATRTTESTYVGKTVNKFESSHETTIEAICVNANKNQNIQNLNVTVDSMQCDSFYERQFEDNISPDVKKPEPDTSQRNVDCISLCEDFGEDVSEKLKVQQINCDKQNQKKESSDIVEAKNFYLLSKLIRDKKMLDRRSKLEKRYLSPQKLNQDFSMRKLENEEWRYRTNFSKNASDSILCRRPPRYSDRKIDRPKIVTEYPKNRDGNKNIETVDEVDCDSQEILRRSIIEKSTDKRKCITEKDLGSFITNTSFESLENRKICMKLDQKMYNKRYDNFKRTNRCVEDVTCTENNSDNVKDDSFTIQSGSEMEEKKDSGYYSGHNAIAAFEHVKDFENQDEEKNNNIILNNELTIILHDKTDSAYYSGNNVLEDLENTDYFIIVNPENKDDSKRLEDLQESPENTDLLSDASENADEKDLSEEPPKLNEIQITVDDKLDVVPSKKFSKSLSEIHEREHGETFLRAASYGGKTTTTPKNPATTTDIDKEIREMMNIKFFDNQIYFQYSKENYTLEAINPKYLNDESFRNNVDNSGEPHSLSSSISTTNESYLESIGYNADESSLASNESSNEEFSKTDEIVYSCVLFDKSNNPTLIESRDDLIKMAPAQINRVETRSFQTSDEQHEKKYETVEITQKQNTKIAAIVKEMIETEKTYVKKCLERIVYDYISELKGPDVLPVLKEHSRILFGNIVEIYAAHRNEFYPALKYCRTANDVANCFLKFKHVFAHYPEYSRRKARSDKLMPEYSHFFSQKQKQLNDPFDLASYLLTPIQRIARYLLFIKSLIKETAKMGGSTSDLELAAEMVEVEMHRGNDYIALDMLRNIKWKDLKEQGNVLLRNAFIVWTTSNKYTFDAMIFLFEKAVLITKILYEDSGEIYVYRDMIKMEHLGITALEYNPCEFKIWYEKHDQKVYTIRTKTEETKTKWIKAINDELWKQLMEKKSKEKRTAFLFPEYYSIKQ